MTVFEAVATSDEHVGPSGSFDAVVWVAPAGASPSVGLLAGPIEAARAVDRSSGDGGQLLVAPAVAGGRLVASTVPSLDRDDVRAFAEAAAAGMRRARAAGAIAPVLVVDGAPPTMGQAAVVAGLGAVGALWEPLEGREARGASIEPVQRVGFWGQSEAAVRWIEAVEAGRRVARDLCGTEPERMAPEGFAAYCEEVFAGTAIEVSVEREVAVIERDYPLLCSVARASLPVERHRPRIVRLRYRPDGPVERTLMFAGKGVTYDSGGLDIKTGGHMAGMSRDKGGGAAVAGFLRTVGALQPKGVAVVAEIGLVRNSVGAEAFATDEVITSHAGPRVKIGSTDAEGRLVMADLLSHLREEAVGVPTPHLFTCATLTGHAALAVGPYAIAIDNGPAREARMAERLSEVGDAFGDPFEVSRLRREDWAFVQPQHKGYDVLSCNNGPSSRTPRGHQFPAAFLAIASGIAGHDGPGADPPLPFTHVDIAGSGVEGGDWFLGHPTGSPVTTLTAALLEECLP